MLFFRLAFLLLLIAPFLEFMLIRRIVGAIGGAWTLAWLGGTAVVGWALCRGLGTRVGEQLRKAAIADRVGGTQGVLLFDEITAAAIRGLAGILLILPGAVTDGLAIVLLLPPFRLAALWLLRAGLVRSVDASLRAKMGAETPPRPEASPTATPPTAGATAAGGSPGPDSSRPDARARPVEEGWVVRDVDFEIVDDDEPPG